MATASRIKWVPQPGEWPDQKTAAKSRLFSQVNLGPVSLEQRTWIPAMVPWRATGDGEVTPAVLDCMHGSPAGALERS